MKQQVRRLSPHQNGKVFGVLAGVLSLLFVVPMSLAFHMMPAQSPNSAPPTFIFFLFPLLYLVMGYLSAAAFCLVYNFSFKYIGGIEYDVANVGD